MGLQLKRMAGFGKGGYKNFEGIITELQMQTYLVVKDFRRKRNKKGGEYGMPVCVYSKPEDMWGIDLVQKVKRIAFVDDHTEPFEVGSEQLQQF